MFGNHLFITNQLQVINHQLSVIRYQSSTIRYQLAYQLTASFITQSLNINVECLFIFN